MKLSKDARVYSQDGKEIGNLNRFVLDPITKQVSHIVIGKGLLDRKEYVVKMQMIDRVDDQGIFLKDLPFDQVDNLDIFEEENYVITDEEGLLNEGYVSDQMARRYYYYPPEPGGAAGLIRPDDAFMNSTSNSTTGVTPTGIPVSGNEPPVRKEVEQNIPEGMVALKEGAKVVASDGKNAGSVEKVILNSDTGQATHIVVTKGLLTRERRLVPVDWVVTINEDEVRLSMDERFIKTLPEYD